MTQPPMRIEEELCPINIRFPPNKSNVRIDPKDPQYEPIFDISLEILNNNTIYNTLTLTTKVPMIYMQQFWYIVYKNKQSNIYFFHLDFQCFEIRTELIRNALQISLRQPNIQFISPHYSAKGERKLTFGMPIPKAILRGGIKDSQVYADYVTKYPQAQIAPKLKIGKGKESKKQAILKESKRKDIGEGLGAAPKSLDHSSSSKDSSESGTDDKTESEKEDHDENSDNGDDQNEDFMKKHEPLPKSFPTQVPRLANLEQQNRADVIEESVQANVLNEVRNQLPKLLPKAVSNALKQTLVNLSWPTPTPSVDPSKYKLKHHLYEKMFQTATYLKHPKHRLLYDALQELMQIDELETRFGSTKPSHTKRTHNDQDLEDREGEKSKKRRKIGIGESLSKKSKDQDEPPYFKREEPEEHEYKDGSMTYFGKLVKKIFIKDKIIKEDVYGVAFELLKGTCKNSVELKYNMDQ
ncbi:hypothetical protein Tco_1286188 [Tanacetum coccineum]